ncbi:MGMT family protein [Halegenticoccus tardaugens]|uniref:MGMT family protein n=1 Tax=Halegenticoccus tardaugens TaxID=2071624 RepID=UPI00100B73FF|nr:MGMT family protein [Halegenticoccus tardaugens]
MDDTGIYARESSALGRAVQLGIASGRVISVSFPEDVPDDAETEHALLDRVFDYLDGASDRFDDVSVALTVPTDRRRALDALRDVPRGETVSVERLARLAGLDAEDDDDLATVRTALSENPVPIFVPDHRVRGASGATPSDVRARLREIEGSG